VPNFDWIGLFCRPLAAKNPKFCRFWTSAFSGIASWRQSEKVEQGAQLQTSASKSFLYSNTKSDAQTLTFKSVMDRQTDKNSTFLAAPPAGETLAQPNLAW